MTFRAAESGELATSGSPARILSLSALSSFCIATAILISPFGRLVAVQASGSTSGYAGKVTYEPPGGSIPRIGDRVYFHQSKPKHHPAYVRRPGTRRDCTADRGSSACLRSSQDVGARPRPRLHKQLVR